MFSGCCIENGKNGQLCGFIIKNIIMLFKQENTWVKIHRRNVNQNGFTNFLLEGQLKLMKIKSSSWLITLCNNNARLCYENLNLQNSTVKEFSFVLNLNIWVPKKFDYSPEAVPAGTRCDTTSTIFARFGTAIVTRFGLCRTL